MDWQREIAAALLAGKRDEHYRITIPNRITLGFQRTSDGYWMVFSWDEAPDVSWEQMQIELIGALARFQP